MALAAPLGVVLDQQWGLASIGVLTILICAISFAVPGIKNLFRWNPASICPLPMSWAA